MNINFKIYKHVTTSIISFIHTLPKNILIEKIGAIKYNQNNIFMEDFIKDDLVNFQLQLNNNSIYSISVLLSKTGNYNDPFVSLTREFLITKDSNEYIIRCEIEKQIDKFITDFITDTEGVYKIIFRYREVNVILNENI